MTDTNYVQVIDPETMKQIEPVVKDITDGITQAQNILAILKKLLNKEIANKIAPLAKKMRCQSLIKVAVTGLDICLQALVKIADFLRQQSQQLIALSGVSLLFTPIVTGIGDLIGDAGKELKKLGVPLPDITSTADNNTSDNHENGQEDSLKKFTETAKGFLKTLSDLIDLLPKQKTWDEITDSLKTIQGFSANFRAQLN